MEEQKLREKMYQLIKGTNKYMTDSYLNTLSTETIINLLDPRYREEYQSALNTLKGYKDEE